MRVRDIYLDIDYEQGVFVVAPSPMPNRKYVYFALVKNLHAIKIGCSKQVPHRLKQIQTMHSEEVELILALEGGLDLERAYHRDLKAWRLKGEWYAPEGVYRLLNNLLHNTVDPLNLLESTHTFNYN